MLEDPRRSDSLLEGLLHRIFREMMPPFPPAAGIERSLGRGENVLPAPLFWRGWILARERVRQKILRRNPPRDRLRAEP